MPKLIGDAGSACIPLHQPDVVLNEVSPPVSTTLYTVLPTQRNVRLISISAHVTWAVNQPTLDVVVTIDGNTIIHTINNPVTATDYEAFVLCTVGEAAQVLGVAATYSVTRSFLYEGRSVRVQARYTGAVGTTALVCRVKWAAIP